MIKAKKVYEFVQKKSLKNIEGDNIGIKHSLKIEVEKWFEKWDPNAEYYFTESDILMIKSIKSFNNNKNLIKFIDYPEIHCRPYLDLGNSGLEWLPNNLRCNYLDLRNTPIKQLPENLTCETLYLMDCVNLTELPLSLNIEEQCFIENTNITSIKIPSDDIVKNDIKKRWSIKLIKTFT